MTGEPADVTIEKRNASRKELQQLLLGDGDGVLGRVDAMPVFFGGRELREVSTREAGRRYRVNGRRRYGHGGVATFSEDIVRSARRIFLTPAQMQKRLKKRYDARTPQSVSHRAYARERKRYASTLVLSPHAIVPNCSYLLASSVGIRRVPSRRRSSSSPATK